MSGYIGTQPVPQATQTRQTFTATASQTSFATGGYQAGYLDVFLNGVKLVDGTDYTATNGSDVVLTTGAASGDTLEVVAYTAFEVLNQNFTGGLTVDNDAATVLTVDRATSNGTIIDVQKDGTSVGSISTHDSRLAIGSDDTYIMFDSGSTPSIWPSSGSAATNGVVSVGDPNYRFKDLYLSGGVYLGGTGSANLLDDVETGTWTPTVSNGGFSSSVTHATYTKVGSLVHIQCFMDISGTGNTGALQVSGLPFNTVLDGYAAGTVDFGRGSVKGTYARATQSGSTIEFLYPSENNSVDRLILKGNQVGAGYIIINLQYRTNA